MTPPPPPTHPPARLAAVGVPRLTNIAAAALQLKLMSDVKRLSVQAEAEGAAGSSGERPSGGRVNRLASSFTAGMGRLAAMKVGLLKGDGSPATDPAAAEAAGAGGGATKPRRKRRTGGSSGGGELEEALVAGNSAGAAGSGEGGEEEGCEGLCSLCFERVPNLAVYGCAHTMCSQCATTMCMRVTDKPLACPFCRNSVRSFVRTSVSSTYDCSVGKDASRGRASAREAAAVPQVGAKSRLVD